MSKYDKFKAYWESLGRPPLQSKLWGETGFHEAEVNEIIPYFASDKDYRIANDKHWELRLKWINSDFTLPVQVSFNKLNGWHNAAYYKESLWHQDYDYRECETVTLPRKLTAENGAKKLLIGEFIERREVICPECNDIHRDRIDCVVCDGKGVVIQHTPISWATIKAIYDKIVEHYGKVA